MAEQARPDITRSTDLLVTLLGHAIAASRFACRELSDDEFFWEPVTPCWGVRRREDATAATVLGGGDWVVEAWGDDPPRVTTIGWRAVHLAVGAEVYLDNTFRGGASTMADADIPSSAVDTVARLHAVQDQMLEAFGGVADADLAHMRRTHWGDELPLWQLLWTSIVEQLHHGAEIGALRDVRRGHANRDWWPELQTPGWWPLS
jgi:hypothetical protein